MKKLKNVLAFSMIFSLVLTAACSKSDKTDKESNTGTPTTSKDTPKQQEEAVFDMKGESIKLLVWGGGPDPKTEEGDLTLQKQAEVEKKYNTKVIWDVVPWGEAVQKLTAAQLSGEPAADLVMMEYAWAFPVMAAQGYFRTVDDIFNFDDAKWPKNLRQVGSYDGKMYGFTTGTGAATGIYYNRAILEREGLKDPHDLVAKNEWNWDAFLNIANKATRDLDGDSKIDQWGLVGYAPIITRNWIYANNGKIVDNINGKLTFTCGEPNAIEAMRYMYDLVHTHKAMMPNTNGNFEDYNESQKVFNSGKAAMVSGEIWEGSTRGDMTDEYGFVWYPKGPKATEYSNVVTNFSLWFMPSNAKHPKEVAKIFEELQLWDRLQKNEKQGVEGCMRAPKDVEMAIEMSKKVEVLYFPGIVSGDDGLEQRFNEAVKSFTMSTDTPESAIEKFKQPAQELIDSVMTKK